MNRFLLSFSLALVTAIPVFFGMGAMRATAQPAPPAVKYPEVQDAFQQYAKDRNLVNCIKALNLAVGKYPELPSPHVLMYNFFNWPQVNQPGAARAMLEDAVRATPSDPEPYIILGELALQERRLNEAMMEFDKAKTLLATYAKAVRKEQLEFQTKSGIAGVAESREDWREAESGLQDLLKSAPENLLARQRLARAQFHQGNVAEAYKTLQAAKQLDRGNAKNSGTPQTILTPEAIIAQYYDQLEGPKSTTGNAEKWFNFALKMAPDDLPTIHVVANWALKNGKLDFAKKLAETILKIESDPKYVAKYGNSKVGRELRGLVALWQEDWETAEKNFNGVLLEDPNNFTARNNLALALVGQDPADPMKRRKAARLAEDNYRDSKKDFDAKKSFDAKKNFDASLSTLGWVSYRNGEFEQAWNSLNAAVAAAGGIVFLDPDTACYFAHVLHHQNKDLDAKAILEHFLQGELPFMMRHRALALYEKVKDAQAPGAASATP